MPLVKANGIMESKDPYLQQVPFRVGCFDCAMRIASLTSLLRSA